MVTRADIIAELERRKAQPKQESFADALLRAPGAAGRMAVGGVAELGGLVADPLGDVIEYATGYPIAPAKESALALYDTLTGGEYAPRNKSERVAQSAGEFLTGGGALGALSKVASAPAAIQQAFNVGTKSEALGLGLGGATQQVTKEADLPVWAQMSATIGASMLPGGAKNLGRAMLPKTSKEVVDAQLASGGKITVGSVVGGDIVPRIESGIAQAPLIGGKIRATRADAAQALQQRIDDIADVISPSQMAQPADAGTFIRTATDRAARSLRQSISKQYDEVFDTIPKDVNADTSQTMNLLNELKQQYRFNDDALGYLNKTAVTKLAEGNIPARELKFLRGQIDDIADAVAKKGMKRLSGDLKGLSRQLNDDIKDTASRLVQGAGDRLTRIDDQYKSAMDLTGRIESWVGSRGNEQLAVAFNKLGQKASRTSAKGANQSTLEDIFRLLPKDEANELSGYLLRNMGRDADNNLSALSFANEYRALTPTAKTLLFGRALGKERMNALDKIVDFAESSKMTLNPSGTAGSALDIAGVSAPIASIIAGSSPTTLGMALLPYFAGRGMASQTLAKAINKLPRAALGRSIDDVEGLAATLMSYGASESDVQGLKQSIDTQNRIRQITEELERRKNGTSLDTTGGNLGNGNDRTGAGVDLRNNAVPFLTSPQSSLPQSTRENEGLRFNSYMDTTGNRTVGYGFNMDSGIAPKVWQQAGIQSDFDAVYRGEQAITPQEAELLGSQSFKVAFEDALDLFPDLRDYTPARQEAILDLSYQLGKPRFSQFSSTISAAKKGQWTTAARHLLKSEYAEQTPNRARKIARMLING